MNEETIKLFDNTFFEWKCGLLTTKFYIDGSELKIVLTRSTFFRTVEVEIRSTKFHVIKQLSSNEPVRLKYQFDDKNQLVFAENFLKNLYINIKRPKEIIANKMILYHDPACTNDAEKLLEYCRSNITIKFELEKVYPNQIVF
jgi:hypothetical protein